MRFIFIILLSLTFSFSIAQSAAETNKRANDSFKPVADKLILKENSLGDFLLIKGMPIDQSIIQATFDEKVSKSIATQDGPDFYMYNIDEYISINTSDMHCSKLSTIRISGSSDLKDQYGISIGIECTTIKARRPNIKIVTNHHAHTYLYEDGSNIAYEMSTSFNSGPDRTDYSLEELSAKGSKVIGILWR
jgi:hypothetical protein